MVPRIGSGQVGVTARTAMRREAHQPSLLPVVPPCGRMSEGTACVGLAGPRHYRAHKDTRRWTRWKTADTSSQKACNALYKHYRWRNPLCARSFLSRDTVFRILILMEPLLTAAEAAKMLKVSVSTLQRVTASGSLHPIRVSKRCVRYSPHDLEAFVRAAPPTATAWPFRISRR